MQTEIAVEMTDEVITMEAVPEKGLKPVDVQSFTSFNQINKDLPQYHIVASKLGCVAETRECFKKSKKTILDDINVKFPAGKMIAVMGSSGSGKTTLLSVLRNRFQGKVTGEMLVNGGPITKQFRKHTAYVMQEDLLLPNLTVFETLMYAAKLRLPRELSYEKKKEMVEEIIKVLNLGVCRDTYIGGEMRKGISGGQKKRVSIAQELLTNPSVILLDEPTSGLDSSTSINLIQSLKDFSGQGRTIISTIHQPSAELFFLFDKVLLLANGKQVYYGSTKKVVSYFAKLGYECPMYQNVADYVLNLITSGYKLKKGNEVIESAVITQDLIEKYVPKQKNGEKQVVQHQQGEKLLKEKEEDHTPPPPTEFSRFATLLHRNFLDTTRNPQSSIAKIIVNVVFGVLFGLIYLRLKRDQAGISDRGGALFFFGINVVMQTAINELNSFPSQRFLFLRERGGNWYGLFSYYFSRTLSILPFQALPNLLFSLVLYWMVGLDSTADKFFTFFACLLVLNLVATSFAVLITTMVGSFSLSIILAPALLIPLMVLGGFFIRSSSIPKYLIWLKFISPFKYGFEILYINEMKGLNFICKATELANGVCPITTGEQAIKSILESGASIWRGFVVLIAIYVFCNIFSLVFLHLSTKQKK